MRKNLRERRNGMGDRISRRLHWKYLEHESIVYFHMHEDGTMEKIHTSRQFGYDARGQTYHAMTRQMRGINPNYLIAWVIPHADPETVANIAEQIRQNIEQGTRSVAEQSWLSVAGPIVGVATYRENGNEA